MGPTTPRALRRDRPRTRHITRGTRIKHYVGTVARVARCARHASALSTISRRTAQDSGEDLTVHDGFSRHPTTGRAHQQCDLMNSIGV